MLCRLASKSRCSRRIRRTRVNSSPAVTHPEWRFGGEELTRVRRIRRLQRDFEANLQAVGAMLELIDEIDRLRAQLQRAGIASR